VTGARGMFVCDLLSQELWFYENNAAPGEWDALSILRGVSEGNVLGIRIQRREPLLAELQDFVDAVCDHRMPRVTGYDGHETLRIALQFIQSAATTAIIHEEVVTKSCM
jgi:UDP-N-acetylglucosamine 3-dehydrogenase